MKNKKNIPWYNWQFSSAGIFWILMLAYMLFSLIKAPDSSFILKLIVFIPISLLLWYFAKSEWKFRKPYRMTIKRNENKKS
jgi:hypothetical protein